MDYVLKSTKLIPNIVFLLSSASYMFPTARWYKLYCAVAPLILRLLQTEAGYKHLVVDEKFSSIILQVLNSYTSAPSTIIDYIPLSILKHKYDIMTISPSHLYSIISSMKSNYRSIEGILANSNVLQFENLSDLELDSILFAMSYNPTYKKIIQHLKKNAFTNENSMLQVIAKLVQYPFATSLLLRITKELLFEFMKHKLALPLHLKEWLENYLKLKADGVCFCSLTL